MNKLSKKNLVVATAVLVAVIMIVSLFVLKIGVSDNGMQYKLLEKLGLYDVYQTTGTGYYSKGFGVANKNFSGTTYGLVYDLSKQLYETDKVVPVAVPAILYAIILICSAALTIFSLYSEKFKKMNLTASLLYAVIFFDSAYVAYLNTPYKNAAFFVFLMATIAMFVYSVKTQKILSVILYGLFACLFAGTTTIAAVTAIIVGAYSFRLMFLKKENIWRIVCLIMSAVIVIFGVFSTGVDVGDAYDSVFYGAAFENPNAVAELGLNSALAEFNGVPSFDVKAQKFINSPEYEKEFRSKVSVGDVAGYYFKNIPQLYKGLKKVGYNSTAIRTSYLGGFTPDTGKGNSNTNFFTLYSFVKLKAVPGSVVFFMLVLLALIGVSFVYRNNYAKNTFGKIVSEFCAVFALCTMAVYPIPYVLNGITQIGFNMFGFNLMFDICIYMLILSTINLLATKKSVLKEKYGVNQ